MAAGKKYNGAQLVDSGSWMDKYGITKANADNLINVKISKSLGANGPVEVVEADYIGSGAITTDNYKGLPKYSKIWDHQSNKYHIHTADSGTDTFVSSAAAS